MTIKCDWCGDLLSGPGGLAFSPPQDRHKPDAPMVVAKFHLCVRCWERLLAIVHTDRNRK